MDKKMCIVVDKDVHNRLQEIGNSKQMSLRQVVKLVLEFYEENHVEPKKNLLALQTKVKEILAAQDKILNTIKEQEKKTLKPALNAVLLSEALLKKAISALSEKGEEL